MDAVTTTVQLAQQRLHQLRAAVAVADDADEATAIIRARLNLLLGARELLPHSMRDKCWLLSVEKAE